MRVSLREGFGQADLRPQAGSLVAHAEQ